MVFDKINVWMIVVDHLKTLREFQSDKPSTGDVILFLIVPLLIALGLVLPLGFRLDVDAINALITSLSVFSGLLFNLLLLIYDLLVKENAEEDPSRLRRMFLGQIYAHISFTILTAVLSISLLLLLFIRVDLPALTMTVHVIILFLIINFILTMLMILQRVHILISKEL
jgi:amino acid transporter